MKPFHTFITSASLFSLALAHANSHFVQETFPSSSSLFSSDFEADDELSSFEDETNDFEEEILAFEEELDRAEDQSEESLTALPEQAFEEDLIEEDAIAFEEEPLEDPTAFVVISDDMMDAPEEETLFEEDPAAFVLISEDTMDAAEEETLLEEDPAAFVLISEDMMDANAEEMPVEMIEVVDQLEPFIAETAEPFQAIDRDPAATSISPIEISLEQTNHPQTELLLNTENLEPTLTGDDPSMTDSLIAEVDQAEIPSLDKLAEQGEAPATLDVQSAQPETAKQQPAIEVNLEQAFAGAPYIYTLLGMMSVASVGIWLYSLLALRKYGGLPQGFSKNIQNKLNSNQFEEALSLCALHENVFSKMIASGINTRRHGLPVMIESMKTEGKRASIHFWQRIGLLNDIAIIAPMLGLLGTVLGMFYAFYDINRSIESISTLFDGLGVSVGTTVAGLVVAILALILHSTAKYRLVKTLANVENEAQSFATLIDDRTSVKG